MLINSPVQKIKERLSIEDIVSSYIKLEKAGVNFKAKCPFHNEKTPSFFISPNRGSYYCFGCGASGDIFSFVEQFEGLDFKGALKFLANKAGIILETFSKENKEKESEKERLYKVMEEATLYFENNLKDNTKVLEYLKNRGLTEKSIKDFRIGYSLLDWRTLYDYLKSKNFSDIEIEKAGLIKNGEKGMYDRFRGRIMFPISDTSGRIIAFSGRIFIDDNQSSKYLNSPETSIFNKSSVFYGLDKAKDAIRKNNFSILVEGQMDLVLAHQIGYKNTIATSGTALRDDLWQKENVVSNLGLLRRLSLNIVLAFDPDKAGFMATQRAGKIALTLDMDVKVALFPIGIDPADLILKSGVDIWRDIIKNSKHIIEFLLDKILKDEKNDKRKIGKEIKDIILPYVLLVKSSIEKNHFLKIISEHSGISQSALEEDLKNIPQELKHEKEDLENTEENLRQIYRKDYILRKLLGIIFWQKTLKESSINIVEIIDKIASILNLEKDEVLKKEKDNIEDLIFEAEVFYEKNTSLEKDIEEMLSNLNEEILKEKLEEKMKDLIIAERNEDEVEKLKILKECQLLNNRIEDIKNGRLKL